MRTPRFILSFGSSARGAVGLEQRPFLPRRQDSEMPVRERRRDPPPGSALEEARLDQIGLVEVLERPAVLSDRRGDRADPDRTAAELLDDRRKDPPVELVEPVLVHFETGERLTGGREVDLLLAGHFREVAQAAQKAVGDPGGAAAPRADLARGLAGDPDAEDPRGALHDPCEGF